jgi:hypothetical protein
MNQDGDIDYSKYSKDQLEEALAGINAEKYPRNYANLRSAYVAAAEAHPVPVPEPMKEAEPQIEVVGLWDRVTKSGLFLFATAMVCIWSGYKVLASSTCPAGRRVTSRIAAAICENLGPTVVGLGFVLLGIGVLLSIAHRRLGGGA